MAKMKEFVIEVCELHANGFDIPAIAFMVETSEMMVEYIIKTYYEEYAE
jgi:hypothetical protein